MRQHAPRVSAARINVSLSCQKWFLWGPYRPAPSLHMARPDHPILSIRASRAPQYHSSSAFLWGCCWCSSRYLQADKLYKSDTFQPVRIMSRKKKLSLKNPNLLWCMVRGIDWIKNDWFMDASLILRVRQTWVLPRFFFCEDKMFKKAHRGGSWVTRRSEVLGQIR